MYMRISFPGGKKVDAIFKNFKIKTDQSINNGGEETAPEPFSLFLASIGTCAGIYILNFCQKRNIPTDDIELLLNTYENEENHMIKKININIKVTNNFPDQYKNAIIKTAELCTVKKHLEKPPEINISIQKQV